MKNANQPAYPQNWNEETKRVYVYHGLTKRELIAAMALQGILSDANNDEPPPDCVRVSIWYADVLLAKLKETEPK